MKTGWKLQISILAVALGLVLAPRLSLAGKESSGGGTAVLTQGGWVLADLLLFNSKFVDTYRTGSAQLDDPDNRRFRETNGLHSAEFAVTKEPAYALIRSRLDAWRASSPHVVGLIETALGEIDLTSSFGRPEDWLVQKDSMLAKLGGHKKLPLVYFDAVGEGFLYGTGIVVTENYRKLGDLSKAGLWIHEAMRQIQLTYNDQTPIASVYGITARIVLTNPQAGESLDRSADFGPVVAKVLAGKFDVVRKWMDYYCAKLASFPIETDADAKDARIFMERMLAKDCGDKNIADVRDPTELGILIEGLYNDVMDNYDLNRSMASYAAAVAYLDLVKELRLRRTQGLDELEVEFRKLHDRR